MQFFRIGAQIFGSEIRFWREFVASNRQITDHTMIQRVHLHTYMYHI